MKINKKIVIISLFVLVAILLIAISLFFKNTKKINTEVKQPEVTNTNIVTEESKYEPIASKFCSDRLAKLATTAKEGQKIYNNAEIKYLSFNFDQDSDKEILAQCDVDSATDQANKSAYMALIVLDKQAEEYKVMYTSDYEALALEDAYPEGGYFRNLQIEDINKDGIDEIIWKSGISTTSPMVTIYSPKTNQYFSKTKDYKTGKITFSDNLTTELQTFKDYLNNYSLD